MTGQTDSNRHKRCWNNGIIKYFRKFWRTLEIRLLNHEINVNLKLSKNCVIVATTVANQGVTSSITYKKLYVLAGTLFIQENEKLLEELKSDFKKYYLEPISIKNINRKTNSIFRLHNWFKFSRSK